MAQAPKVPKGFRDYSPSYVFFSIPPHGTGQGKFLAYTGVIFLYLSTLSAKIYITN
jgi:hypothetical protein